MYMSVILILYLFYHSIFSNSIGLVYEFCAKRGYAPPKYEPFSADESSTKGPLFGNTCTVVTDHVEQRTYQEKGKDISYKYITV